VDDVLDGIDDIGIGAAATDIAAHVFTNFLAAYGFAFIKQTLGGTDLPGRAVAALETIMANESLLQWMKPAIGFGHSFDRGDIRTIQTDGKFQATIDTPAIDENRAGTALAVIAAFLRARKRQPVTQEVEQGSPGWNIQLEGLLVDGQMQVERVVALDARRLDNLLHRYAPFLGRRSESVRRRRALMALSENWLQQLGCASMRIVRSQRPLKTAARE
jgi:hypothetical protein